jgi:serine/threonine protein kinase
VTRLRHYKGEMIMRDNKGAMSRADSDPISSSCVLVPGASWGPSGRYIINCRLGRGGMGTVYAATDTILNRIVALKVLDASSIDQHAAHHARILREAQLGARVEHERITRVYDVGVHEGLAFVAMEYVAGHTLRQRLNERALRIHQILDIATMIAEGLAELHATGVIHRDLKPENVMLTELGDVKLLDFGLARNTVVSSEEPGGISRTFVRDGASVGSAHGTPGYMAPEQFTGKASDARVDVFSLGAIIDELVTGQRPFGGATDLTVIATMLEAGAVLEGDTWACAPPSLRDCTARMLARDPQQRYADGGQVLAALRRLSAEIPRRGAPHSLAKAEVPSKGLTQYRCPSLRPVYHRAVRRPWRILAVPVGATAALAMFALMTRPAPSSKEPTAEPAETTRSAPEPAIHQRAAQAPSPRVDFNLSFEQLVGDKPTGWASSTPYDWSVVRDPRHDGEHSLQVRSRGKASAGRVYKRVSATQLRGKHLRLYGWIKSDGVTGWAGMYAMVMDRVRVFDLMENRGITGTTGWTEVMIDVDVCADCKNITLGLMLIGEGIAWFDDLRIEATESEPVVLKPIVLQGKIVDSSGKPVPRADVALVGNHAIPVHVRSDGHGRFRLETQSGKWAVSVNHPHGVGAFLARRRFDESARAIKLVLGSKDGVVVRGRIDHGAFSGNAYVLVAPVSPTNDDLYAVPVNVDGTFETRLARSDEYLAWMIEGGSARGGGLRVGDRAELVLH